MPNGLVPQFRSGGLSGASEPACLEEGVEKFASVAKDRKLEPDAALTMSDDGFWESECMLAFPENCFLPVGSSVTEGTL